MKFLSRKNGQGMTEYILIIALIALAVIASVKFFGRSVNKGFHDAASKIEEEVKVR